jgi:DNA mismatch endonuclease, patch repair protein
MRQIKSRDMKPEVTVRRLVHALGFRFQLHRKDLPGKPDLVFPGRKAIIFVHGCFWHQHPNRKCLDARMPKSNPDYWLPKLSRNQVRDKANLKDLKAAGWRVLVVWECETKDPARLRHKLLTFLKGTYE